MKTLPYEQLKQLLEAAIFTAGKPMSVARLKSTVLANYRVNYRVINQALDELVEEYKPRGVNLMQVGSGFRFQAISAFAEDIAMMFEEKAPRYSRALLETLALIAYRQPITRGEIEDIRGVAVSSHITKTLLERDWIHVVGHKEVPGRPAMYATTTAFLDYFSLKSLAQLPELLPIIESSSENEDITQQNETETSDVNA
ncbi:SMC-Scp complex subunit ScpB [Thalassotalea fusca]